MSLLLVPARMKDRRRIAKGPLAPLAESLASDLAPLLMDGFDLPREKAMMSRAGGRCAADGSLLDFDPFNPRLHRCARCGRTYEGEEHYRWWIMSYQLWLAERAVHAALLGLLRGDKAAGALAESILEQYADAYLGYPNRDNILGPTRLFFSTYLESIWLLQVCVALDLLEQSGLRQGAGARIRERIIEPSAALIRSYDEGASNRQVWNNAALLASTATLGFVPSSESIVWGPSGLVSHLAKGLLADGTWYEGENYHLFAHRGLWYGVQMAERLDLGLGETFVAPFVARFEAGFAASFASALPDLTLPSRRDSQYAISIRQWRFAELCELGLARADDPRLRGMLAQLYADDIPRGDVGRARSTAEVERNLPPTRLTRADLGWRSLLLALPDLPAADPEPPGSVLLAGQGLAVLRRDRGAIHVTLDYGHSGGGHGHPDRLNLTLAHGEVRWLDDMGTGSYVDPTLHWYRSTLAHNAPLVDGRSQDRVSGVLLAYDDDGTFGWADATVSGIAPGVVVRRTVVVTPTHLVDSVEWRAPAGSTIDLPLHLEADAIGAAAWTPAALAGGAGLEDGFSYLTDAACIARDAGDVLTLRGRAKGRAISAWTTVDADHECWRATAPGAPGHPPARFYLYRTRAERGTVRTVLDWTGTVRDVRFGDEEVVVESADVTCRHRRHGETWDIAWEESGTRTERRLRGQHSPSIEAAHEPAVTEAAGPDQPLAPPHRVPLVPEAGRVKEFRPLRFVLGQHHYRRSELQWADAGRPRATVSLSAGNDRLHIDVKVEKDDRVTFAPRRDHNALDNEHPDINSDGIQVHLADPGSTAVLTWLLVPEGGTDAVRIHGAARAPELTATWAPARNGYVVRCTLPLTPRMKGDGFDLDVIVNEIGPDRARRRGQLVMSGGGDWIYLRGDRQPRERLMHFVVATDD